MNRDPDASLNATNFTFTVWFAWRLQEGEKRRKKEREKETVNGRVRLETPLERLSPAATAFAFAAFLPELACLLLWLHAL